MLKNKLLELSKEPHTKKFEKCIYMRDDLHFLSY